MRKGRQERSEKREKGNNKQGKERKKERKMQGSRNPVRGEQLELLPALGGLD